LETKAEVALARLDGLDLTPEGLQRVEALRLQFNQAKESYSATNKEESWEPEIPIVTNDAPPTSSWRSLMLAPPSDSSAAAAVAPDNTVVTAPQLAPRKVEEPKSTASTGDYMAKLPPQPSFGKLEEPAKSTTPLSDALPSVPPKPSFEKIEIPATVALTKPSSDSVAPMLPQPSFDKLKELAKPKPAESTPPVSSLTSDKAQPAFGASLFSSVPDNKPFSTPSELFKPAATSGGSPWATSGLGAVTKPADQKPDPFAATISPAPFALPSFGGFSQPSNTVRH